MINLIDDIDYFILIDRQVSFGGGIIYEGIEEIIEQFRHWAEADGYEDPTLKGWTISELLSHWSFDMKIYDGGDFVELSKDILNKVIN